MLASAVPVDTVVAMRLNAIVVDLAVLGPQAWEYLEKLCAAAAGARRRRVHGPVDGRPARARPAARRRRLADQAVPPRGAHRPRRGRRAPPPPRRGARVGRARSPPARSRSAPTASRPSSTTARSTSRAASSSSSSCWPAAEGRVLEREEIYQRVWGYAMARGDRSVDVFVRKLRQKLEKASPDWRYIHTHFGVGYRFSPEPDGRRGHRARAGHRGAAPAQDAAPRRRRPRRPARDAVVTATIRNVAIILVLAAAVAFVPGGGTTAGLIGALLSTRSSSARDASRRASTASTASSSWPRRPLAGAPLRRARRHRAGDGRTAAAVETVGRHARRGWRAVAGSGYALYRVWRHYREYA